MATRPACTLPYLLRFALRRQNAVQLPQHLVGQWPGVVRLIEPLEFFQGYLLSVARIAIGALSLQ